jgi:predicted site-specific integrase-resolvase
MEQCFPAFGREDYRKHELQPPARTMSKKASKPKPKRAVAYARRSANHPQSSIGRQMAVLRKYAKQRCLEVVMACSDGRKGGGKP